MKYLKTPCPSCNSPQKFVPEKVQANDQILTRVVCRMCKHEMILKVETVEKAHANKKTIRLRNAIARRAVR